MTACRTVRIRSNGLYRAVYASARSRLTSVPRLGIGWGARCSSDRRIIVGARMPILPAPEGVFEASAGVKLPAPTRSR
jgi:hypothetical protein